MSDQPLIEGVNAAFLGVTDPGPTSTTSVASSASRWRVGATHRKGGRRSGARGSARSG